MRIRGFLVLVTFMAGFWVLWGCDESNPVGLEDDAAFRTTDGITLARIPGLDVGLLINDRRVVIGLREGKLMRRTPNGTITPLLPVNGRQWSYAFDMNNTGTVLGGDLERRWLWHAERGTHMLPSSYSWVALNDAGQVVGNRTSANFEESHSAIYTPGRGIRKLRGLGSALDLNIHEEAVGYNVRLDAFGDRHFLPIYWDREGDQHAMDPVDHQGASATSISDNGHIVGWAFDLTPVSAVQWFRGEPGDPYRYLGQYLSRAGHSEAYHVNNAGLILGIHESSYNGAPWRATVWFDGLEWELGTLDGIDYYESLGYSLQTIPGNINNHGEVIGSSPHPEPPHALVAVRWTIPGAWWQGHFADGNSSRSRLQRGSTAAPPALAPRTYVDPGLPVPLTCGPAIAELGVRAVAACARLGAAVASGRQ